MILTGKKFKKYAIYDLLFTLLEAQIADRRWNQKISHLALSQASELGIKKVNAVP